ELIVLRLHVGKSHVHHICLREFPKRHIPRCFELHLPELTSPRLIALAQRFDTLQLLRPGNECAELISMIDPASHPLELTTIKASNNLTLELTTKSIGPLVLFHFNSPSSYGPDRLSVHPAK